ncbi:unnamed protein product [Medioppia subpectinata]|uniref:Sushi domain-containing protein n=1 Tax=Medioppia subpectinata TaxID=1979941 RepID=A0A7R9KYF4_9ACAR|nr:unnamed protein product [Medioppia subpectinata]CAG2112189.1 unnamed protein product [Medioppia subpectinata]
MKLKFIIKVEELHYGTISVIDLADRKNHSLEYRNRWSNKDTTAAYNVDYKRDTCLRSNKMSRPHSWKLHLRKVKRHISYLEVVVLDKSGRLMKSDARNIIKYSKVNDLRECVPKVIETTDTTIRLGLTCVMEFDGDSKDKTQMITIEFDVNDISICEIRLYTNSFMPFHRCGSADIVLFSSMEFIKSGNKYTGNSYYRYKCDEGFQLDGPEDVRCGLNNNWLDPFPVCKPKAQCPYPPSVDESMVVGIKPEHLYTFNANISALVGSVIYYKCLGDRNNTIMIGDSVRVCGTDSKWSGVDPKCIRDSELNADSFKDIKDTENADKHMTTFQSFNKLLTEANSTALACGLPAMPLFAKPTTSGSYRMFGGQSDLRRWYENGTVINYQCESAYRWVSGDVGKRTCVEGQWTGALGKCVVNPNNNIINYNNNKAVNWGNLIRLTSVYVYDMDKSNRWTTSHMVTESNSTSDWEEHFAYRRDADKGECATFAVDSNHKWSLRLNTSVTITYFVVMLHPGGFFGGKHKISDPKILDTTPVTATVGRNKNCVLTSAWDYTHTRGFFGGKHKISDPKILDTTPVTATVGRNKNCVLTSAWDYTHTRYGTYFFFTCDMDEPKYRYVGQDYYINLYIDPKKFEKSYTAKNISLCSLAVMVSKQDDCGTPDIPLHSTVSQNENHEWTYACDPGYKLVGSPTMSCGRNGRWKSQEFPTCVKKSMCPVTRPARRNDLYMRAQWQNVIQKDNKLIASVDSIVNHSCIASSKKILIGSEIRLCAVTGEWSGTEPYCMDLKDLPKSSSKGGGSTVTVFVSVLSVLLAIGLVAGLVYFVFHKGYLRSVSNLRVPNLTIPKINIQRASGAPAAATAATEIDHNANSFDSPVHFEPMPLPKQRTTTINNNSPQFSRGTEFLVERDHDD